MNNDLMHGISTQVDIAGYLLHVVQAEGPFAIEADLLADIRFPISAFLLSLDAIV
jgi:hypothetical protein